MLQGTVDVHACFADHAVSTTIYIATLPCQPLIGHDLIDGLGLIIQGRGALKPEDQSSVTCPELPPQPQLILTVCPSTGCMVRMDQNSYAKGVSGCSDRHGPVSHKLGVLSDNSTVLQPQTGQKVTPGQLEEMVESRTIRNREQMNLRSRSALK